MNDAFETSGNPTQISRTGCAIKAFTVVLLSGLLAALVLRYALGIDYFVVLGVSLALATLCVLALIDGGWFGSTPGTMVFGLIVAVPVRLVFETGFFAVLAVSVALGVLHPVLKGKEYREAARQRQRQAMSGETDHVGSEQEYEEGDYEPDVQDVDGGQAVTVRPQDPQELRAMPYKEYLHTPHWKRRREDKLRASGYRCQVCNRGSGILDVHHRTYKRRGEELDEDLTVLCRECHHLFHEHGRLGP